MVVLLGRHERPPRLSRIVPSPPHRHCLALLLLLLLLLLLRGYHRTRYCAPQGVDCVLPTQAGDSASPARTTIDRASDSTRRQLHASTGVHPAGHPAPAPTISHCCEEPYRLCSPCLRRLPHRRTLTSPSTAPSSRTRNNTNTGSTGTHRPMNGGEGTKSCHVQPELSPAPRRGCTGRPSASSAAASLPPHGLTRPLVPVRSEFHDVADQASDEQVLAGISRFTGLTRHAHPPEGAAHDPGISEASRPNDTAAPSTDPTFHVKLPDGLAQPDTRNHEQAHSLTRAGMDPRRHGPAQSRGWGSGAVGGRARE